ncbi:MAG: hypothetical protein Q8O31_04835 [Rhodocyclaceae bacterium]|nr:hypothetical protein [Rhodocyclaceae bacterium]
MTSTPNTLSSAHAPDLDWSQVRETVLLLELAAGQVDAAMRDSSRSVSALTDSFTSMADTLSSIDAALGTLPDSIAVNMVKDEIQKFTGDVSGKAQQAVIAFQFFDKLTQRLDHVCGSLNWLSILVSDKMRLYNPNEWMGLRAKIRSKYTMSDENEMFDAVMRGMPVKEAIERYLNTHRSDTKPEDGGIELF